MQTPLFKLIQVIAQVLQFYLAGSLAGSLSYCYVGIRSRLKMKP